MGLLLLGLTSTTSVILYSDDTKGPSRDTGDIILTKGRKPNQTMVSPTNGDVSLMPAGKYIFL